MLWPRYIDMKRGFFIVAFISYGIVPWKILSSAAVFTTFLSGYGLFMASVVGIMLAECKLQYPFQIPLYIDLFLGLDYWMSKGNIFPSHLFDPRKTNIHYRYHKGWNLQALIAYIVGIALPFPGFAASLGAKGVGSAGQKMFYLGWLLSFTVSLILYPLICKFWPTNNQKLIRERGLTWEENARAPLTGEDVVMGRPGVETDPSAADAKVLDETKETMV